MKFSLVLCTLGRVKEVGLFLNSLKEQDVDYEIVIIDQNDTNELYDYFNDNYEYLISKTKYIKTDKKGLSRARNIGLKHISGDIVCFPDDDCIYSRKLLNFISDFFRTNDPSLLSILSVNSKNLLENKNIIVKDKLTTFNLFSKAISYSLFFKRDAIEGLLFDEKLGVGAEFGSTEESDFTLNVILKNGNNFFTNSLTVFHPEKINHYDDINRMRYYSLGVGAFFKKNMNKKSVGVYFQMTKAFLGPIMAIIYFKLKNDNLKKTWFQTMLKSRISGFINFDRYNNG